MKLQREKFRKTQMIINIIKFCQIIFLTDKTMASIYLYPKYQSKAYSTHAGNTPHLRSHSSSDIAMQTSRNRDFMNYSRKIYNMNDVETRIKRQINPIYKKSSQQSQLFSGGLKKIKQNASVPRLSAARTSSSLQRSYRNKQTYNILQPDGAVEKHIIRGGTKKIQLQNQQQKAHKAYEQRKKLIRNHNQQHKEQADFYIKKLAGVESSGLKQWGNSHTGVHFSKKENMPNKQNRNSQKQRNEEQLKRKKTIRLNPHKNRSNLSAAEGGIVVKQQAVGKSSSSRLDIDFKQDYFTHKNIPRLTYSAYGKYSNPLTYR